MPQGSGKIRITAPVPGTCPVCAVAHEEQEPHDLESLYYQNQFFKVHKRFPTWADALAHCGPMTKAVWVEKLKKAGIRVVFPNGEGGKGRKAGRRDAGSETGKEDA